MTALLDPRLAQCRRLFLRNHAVQVHIGVHAFEQGAPQRLLINVDLYVPLAASQPTHDRLADVVDYDFIRQAVATRISQGHIRLQETLADELLRAMLAHPGVLAARVSTEKPDVYPDCDAVGVEVFAIKP
jgi:7,8-dihydroneopterin aldolase/epimerase/oxygenase